MLVVSTVLVVAMSCRLVALLGTSGRIAATIQQHRFEALAHASTDVIAIIDDQRRFRYASPTAPARWLLAPKELVGVSLGALVAPKDRALLADRVARVMASLDGTLEMVEVDLDPMVADDARAELILVNLLNDPAVAGIGLTVRDVTERVDLEERMHAQAFHDGLTGLANRALFADRLDHALACVRRAPERVSALCSSTSMTSSASTTASATALATPCWSRSRSEFAAARAIRTRQRGSEATNLRCCSSASSVNPRRSRSQCASSSAWNDRCRSTARWSSSPGVSACVCSMSRRPRPSRCETPTSPCIGRSTTGRAATSSTRPNSTRPHSPTSSCGQSSNRRCATTNWCSTTRRFMSSTAIASWSGGVAALAAPGAGSGPS